MKRVAFLEEICMVVQWYGTQFMLKLIRPLMQEFLEKLYKSERRMSELLIDSATDESETKPLIKLTL